MRNLLHHQLGFRIIMMVLGFLTLVTGLQLIQNFRQNSTQLTRQVDRLGNSLVEAAAAMSLEPLLIQDYPVLETHAQSLVQGDPDIVFASFKLSDGRLVVIWPPETDARLSGDAEVRVFRHPIMVSPEDTDPIGEVILGIDISPMQSESRGWMKKNIIQGLAAFLVLAGFLTWLLYWELRKPLEQLANHALVLGQGGLNRPVPLTGKGELASLSRAFEEMRQRLSASRNELDTKNDDLKYTLSELDQALKRSEQLAKAKDDFLATMSHEIRTPMNGVQGMLVLLVDGQLNSEDTILARTALESAEALQTVLNDILDFSKLESGQFKIDKTPFNFRDLVSQIGLFAEAESRRKSNIFKAVYSDDCPENLLGDPARLRQILLNLVGNALKFTTNGTITLEVKCLDQDAESVKLRVSVLDSGIGIPEDKHKHLFDRFSQVDTATTRKYGGTGLGLAISYQLVTLMGGNMGLKSEAGVGSNFHFEIELGISSEIIQANRPTISTDQQWDSNILLVDDNRVNLMVGERLLKRKGCQVTKATNGQEAVDLIKTESFDLVLMDIMMPVMDGLEATQIIRSLGEPFSKLPIIATTANAMPGDREKYLAAGMDDYIPKPIRVSELDRVMLQFSPIHPLG